MLKKLRWASCTETWIFKNEFAKSELVVTSAKFVKYRVYYTDDFTASIDFFFDSADLCLSYLQDSEPFLGIARILT